MKTATPVLLSYAFRPFFLLAGCFAILVMSAWLLALGGSGLPGATSLWHAHELLIGFALAAVAGFSLTAAANWTGRPALRGAPLAWLVLSWLAGRVAMTLQGWLPGYAVLALDTLFPALLATLLGAEIIAGRNRRNYPLVAIVAVIAALNAVYHMGLNGWLAGADRVAVHLLIHTLLLLVAIIAGRIVPSFTANWLRLQGSDALPVDSAAVGRLALASTLLVGVSASFAPTWPLTGLLAVAATLVHGFRLSRWRGFSTRANPLLLVLHVAYLWLPIGYAALACAVFGWFFTPTAALHALTMGAIGGMVLAVTTRVALGHTGRPLQAAPATSVAYAVFMAAVAVRVLGPLTGGDAMLMMQLSAAGWVLAFALFLLVYWPILTRPRID